MENADRTPTFFRFEDLRIYHKAMDYIQWIYEATKAIKKQEQDNLVPKFNAAARDIALNIAEGSARNKSQFIYYLKMAKSSIRECLVYTSLAYGLGFFDDDQQDHSRTQLMEMTKMIGALISSLQRGTKKESSNDDDGGEIHDSDDDY
jgi:four helix bundle protein